MDTPVLDVRGLCVDFATRAGALRAVDGLDLQVHADEVLAIVGESGSGKSVAMLAVMGLLPWTATVRAERLNFAGHDLLRLAPKARRALLGSELAMIFQEPTGSLNPCFTIGWQIGEALAAHTALTRAQRRARAIDLLAEVGLPDPARRLGSFPHQLSGGMNQRVMIAMALACGPRLLIADEPTTALDVTIQAQILELLRGLTRRHGMALVLITHDLGVVAELADRVLVQYAGQKVEENRADVLLADPHHPYTAALLASLPEQARGARLQAIDGSVPGLRDRPPGCLFAPRCAYVRAACQLASPPAVSPALGQARCLRPLRQGHPLDLEAGHG